MQVGTVHFRFDIDGGKSRYYDEFITEEDVDMPRDKLAALVGDGLAKVTCSLELSDKNFGNGFGAHVSVTLTCNQEEEDVDRAADLASVLVSRYAVDAVQVAEAVFKDTLGHPSRKKEEPERDSDASRRRR